MEKTNALVMMVGLSGSGKSFFAKQLAKEKNMKIFSSDDLREELYGDAMIQADQNKLFNELHRRIKVALQRGESVIYDATNIKRKFRQQFIKEVRTYVGFVEAMVVLTPFHKCVEYNNARERVVPESVIRRQLEGFNMPTIEEGFDAIQFIPNYTKNDIITVTQFINAIANIPHDTPHHKASIQTHSLRVMNGLAAEYPNSTRTEMEAALLHDMGKPMAKSFVKPDGTQLDHAIYYNHDNIGAYLSMFVAGENDIAKWERALIIENHMKPYLGDGAMEKAKQFLPSKIYDAILRINEIDKIRD